MKSTDNARSYIAPACFTLAVIVGCFLLFLPILNAPRSRARHPCFQHIRRLGMAIVNYEATNGRFLPAYIADAAGQPMHSWRILILPFLDDPLAAEIYDQYRFEEPWNGPNNQRLAEKMPAVFRCPAEGSDHPMHTSYVAMIGDDTIWTPHQGRHVRELKKGTSKTLLLIEQPTSGIHWMEPRDVNLDELSVLNPAGPHNHDGSVVVCVYADGHTETLGPSSSDQLRQMATIAAEAKGGSANPQ